ncbi:MAG: glycosyltransferase family A protein [Thermoplasmatales archaeon]
MEVKEDLLFSVIITCHDRRKYIVEAIKSVLAQNIEKSNYEIIIVKNYDDPEIDGFALKNSLILVKTEEKPLARKIVAGIKIARGRYICFLDDDDKYEVDKLAHIKDLIIRIHGFAFYHNSYRVIDEDGKFLSAAISRKPKKLQVFSGREEIRKQLKLLLRERADWYASMMCIRKDALIPKIDAMWQTSASSDKFIFYAGIATGETIILDTYEGTQYRIHPSLTTVLSNYDDFISSKSNFYKESLHTFRIIESIYRNSFISKDVSCITLHASVLSSFICDEGKPGISKEAISVLQCTLRLGYRQLFFWYLMLVAKSIFGNSIRHVYYVFNQAGLSKVSTIR